MMSIGVQVHVETDTKIVVEQGNNYEWIRIDEGRGSDIVLHLRGESLANLAQACQDLAMVRATREFADAEERRNGKEAGDGASAGA